MNRPQPRKRIGITLGDPAGIGPELALRLANQAADFPACQLILIGDAGLLKRVAAATGIRMPDARFCEATDESPSPIDVSPSVGESPPVEIISIVRCDPAAVTPGRWSAASGDASHAWVRYAISEALAGRLDAIVTGPIQKEAWHAAGHRHPGHTELLAEMTGTKRFRMMLTSDAISCVLVTIHIPLAAVAASLTQADVLESIQLATEALRRRCQQQRGRPPRVVVCGLNPHAGEGGLMGLGEEQQIIAPAIEQARQLGIDVVGPLSPDTAFVPARRQQTDVYVCMYHDQGLIPLKALAFDDAVNVTLGLPLVRTSVDHGTAMDIAWQGRASVSSLHSAVRLAAELA